MYWSKHCKKNALQACSPSVMAEALQDEASPMGVEKLHALADARPKPEGREPEEFKPEDRKPEEAEDREPEEAEDREPEEPEDREPEPKPEDRKPEPKSEDRKPEPMPEASQKLWGFSDRDENSPLDVWLTAPPRDELEKVLGFPLSPKRLAEHLEKERRKQGQTGLPGPSVTSALKAAAADIISGGAETAVAPVMQQSGAHEAERPVKDRFLEAAAFMQAQAAEKARHAEEEVNAKKARLEQLRDELARQEMALEEAVIQHEDLCEEKKCIEEISRETGRSLEDPDLAKGASKRLDHVQAKGQQAAQEAAKEPSAEAAPPNILLTPRKPHMTLKAIELSPESPGVETCIV